MLPPGDFHKLPTPCYLIDDERFVSGIMGFKESLDRFFPDNAIGYSVKTNSLPWMIKKAVGHGCMAEVVSEDEYMLARKCNIPPSNIIYNGLMKSKGTMQECLEGGGIVNIDTHRELEWLLSIPPVGRGVGLRLKADYHEMSPADVTGTNDDSRFGFSEESGEFGNAVSMLRDAGIPIEGLHIHRTTARRSVEYYRNAARYAARVIKRHALILRYIDIGGGFFGIFPGKPTFDEYVEAIYSVLEEEGLRNLKLIVEPGSAVSAWSMKFLSSVTDTRRGGDGRVYVTTDASRNDVDPFFRKKGYMFDIYRINPNASPPTERLQIVGGCTCLEDDRLFELWDFPALEEGDIICFNRVGAYTITLSGQFIRFLPAVYVSENGSYKCVRRKSTASDILLTETDLKI